MAETLVPTTGRLLTLPQEPIFALRRAADADYELGAFRAWAGYKDLGAEDATNGLVRLQHVLSFAGTKDAGRTGVHCHLAQVHIVIPTSGRGVFSYDGVTTEAVPGQIIVQHGGTIHDQFEYSYAASSEAENRLTPQTIEPRIAGAPPQSFSFLELFVPRTIADVEIIPPAKVTPDDQRTAWRHPYHASGANFQVQNASAAVFGPVVGRSDLEARDGHTWAPTGGLVATWFIRPAAASSAPATPLGVQGEEGGLDILYMVGGSATFTGGREAFTLDPGDTLLASQGLMGELETCSPDMRLIRFFIAVKAQQLRERTAEEIERLEALGPRIITGRELRPEHDRRPVNFLSEKKGALAEA
jgi:mannose-6-phosphate isomerase-like protein (cupin superfamily)